jgi:serine/threonine-protein kinase RsbW/stage II sporulation protein AB (anti-sigma F factor)
VVLMANPELRATFPGTAPGVGQLRRTVAEVAKRFGLPAEVADAARLAASEAASNAVIHAYREHRGDLHLRASVQDGELRLVIADEGKGLAPRPDSPGLGLGLPIMAQVSERFEIVSGPDGTEIHLAFPVPAQAG